MADKKVHDDQKYIEGLLQNDVRVVNAIYEKFVPKVVRYICNNSGDASSAEDVVQEVLLVIYKQARDKGLQLSCPFDAYFFLLCKRRWLNELKKLSGREVTMGEQEVYKDEGAEILLAETCVEEEKEKIFTAMFQRLGEVCKELLQISFRLKSMEDVAEKMGITYAYARKKKSLCTGKLAEMIRQSPEYKKLKSSL
ncbi:RNA polymerase sigma factor [Sinomicrobium sp.]